MKAISYDDQLITGDFRDSNFSRMTPLMLFFIIVKPKKIHILVRITQNIWKMEMRLAFHKCAWIWSDYNTEWMFHFIHILLLWGWSLTASWRILRTNLKCFNQHTFLKDKSKWMFWMVSVIGPNCQEKQRAEKQTYFVTTWMVFSPNFRLQL